MDLLRDDNVAIEYGLQEVQERLIEMGSLELEHLGIPGPSLELPPLLRTTAVGNEREKEFFLDEVVQGIRMFNHEQKNVFYESHWICSSRNYMHIDTSERHFY